MQLHDSGQLQASIDNGKNAPETFQSLDSVYEAVDVRKLKLFAFFPHCCKWAQSLIFMATYLRG